MMLFVLYRQNRQITNDLYSYFRLLFTVFTCKMECKLLSIFIQLRQCKSAFTMEKCMCNSMDAFDGMHFKESFESE